MITPILTVPCGQAVPGEASNASTAALLRIDRLSMDSSFDRVLRLNRFLLPRTGVGTPASGTFSTFSRAEYCTQSMDFQLSRSPVRSDVAPGSSPIEASQNLGRNRRRAQPVLVAGVAHRPHALLV